MITFSCPECFASYKVGDDKAGLKTRCKACRSLLTVPASTLVVAPPSEPAPPPPPPVSVSEPPLVPGLSDLLPTDRRSLVASLAILAAVVLLALGLSSLGLRAWLPYPDKSAVASRVQDRLPPGVEDFHLWGYDQKTGGIKFGVTYKNYGDLQGVVFEVTRMPGSTDAVDVVATRRVSFEDRKLVRYVYRDGEMKFKSVFFATAADGPWLEEMAAKLDQAVRKAY